MSTTFIKESIGQDVIVLVGAPCSGKTTQGKLLSEALQKPCFAPGAHFRTEIANGTQLGQQLKTYIDSGETIPNELTTDFLTAKLNDPLYQNGMIFDGHPRTLSHLTVLDGTLNNLNKCIFAAIYFDVPKCELDRRRCRRGRNDDNVFTADRRYELFTEDTIPLVNLFARKNKLIKIDYCIETPEEICQQVLMQLDILAQGKSSSIHKQNTLNT